MKLFGLQVAGTNPRVPMTFRTIRLAIVMFIFATAAQAQTYYSSHPNPGGGYDGSGSDGSAPGTVL